ncbi:DUF559 domain-containing protein [Corynebacterium lizhenjunii]|uniref:DUF559 domain-containing protein n=1 Tax=Corynebacterium lizhenjunii TaxID=2709394 RepID=A0A7T0KDR9_9CORY|nr:DUF559 domain-containing protein [Corynebacterium lizhenjunii]QPK78938.1 DUF559 domain-containing protein [Corynebacterium lizhenjunii]
MRNVKGRGEVRRVLKLATGLSESPYEALAYALLHYEGISARQQVNVLEGIRVDLLVGKSVVVEIDGEVKYSNSWDGRSADEMIRDERRREVRLQNAGYRVLRFSPGELFQRPVEFVQTVRRWM